MIRTAGPAKRLVLACLLAACLVTPILASQAQGRTPIRDTEIEATIRAFATPLFSAAGLNPNAVRIYIIKDATLNAFVAGGQNLFLNSGLLMRTESPGQLIGVIAHETGHIAGGHLARTSGAIREASNSALFGLLLGAATTLATGRPDVGIAVFQGTSAAGHNALLQYSQTQESAADHAAIRLLDATGQSSKGLYEFLETLSGQELLAPERRSQYANTHPLTRDRITFARNHAANSPFTDIPPSPEFVAKHQRMVAKLAGFLLSPSRTFQRYPETDNSLPARYARAIAIYREPSIEQALELTDGLIAENPQDGYFWELRGQILAESGQPARAREAYTKALALLGDAPLIEADLARAELAINTEESNKAALRHMENAIRDMNTSAFAWRQLATAQGRNDMPGELALSLAEEALLRNRIEDAVQQAKRAQHHMKRGAPGWLRALDIEELAKRRLSDRDRRR
ncbi:MAG: M48 family metalloprotease [Alphaproteobacteria bacterium]|nr:M48 family metalloprotease [Alphaproteobacteria bacterium]